MTHPSPILDRHRLAEAGLLRYDPAGLAVEVVETFGELDFEYAALRKACALIDLPHRATLELVGPDAIPFVNNMITQEVGALPPLRSARSFWLNRKGRIDGDLRVTNATRAADGARTRLVIDADATAAERVRAGLDAYLITEDAEIRDATASTHRLALHGPTGPVLLAEVAEPVAEPAAGPGVTDLAPGGACVLSLAGHEVLVERQDTAGVPGLELSMAADAVAAVYERLVERGRPANGEGYGAAGLEAAAAGSLSARVKLREIGWLAYNTARIEAGTALFGVDFNADSVPHETGPVVLGDRVSFIKGCYLGQEVVSRMQHLGKPKHALVAFKPEGAGLRDEQGRARQPVGGTQVFAAADPAGDPVGVVTSSTISPMLGGEPVCFAIVRSSHTAPGTELAVSAEGERLVGAVRPGLRFVG